jgi:hypothetical protein
MASQITRQNQPQDIHRHESALGKRLTKSFNQVPASVAFLPDLLRWVSEVGKKSYFSFHLKAF